MRTILGVLLIAFVSIGSICSKKDLIPETSHCNGLVTDTAGTGDNGRVYMSNVFSPNMDGINDLARPYLQNITAIEFKIYDDKMNVVFTSTQLGETWNSPAPPSYYGKFYYRIQATTSSNRHIGICGVLHKMTCIPSWLPASSLVFEDQLTPWGFTGITAENLPTCP